jgi:hypothetical protein
MMTVYDIPNITVEEMGNPVRYYRIFAEPGYVIKLPEYEETVYKTVAIFTLDYDFSTVQIIAESDLPADAEICGNTDNDHETA